MSPWQHNDNAEALLTALGTLIKAHGAERYVAAPLVRPTPAFFPEPWTAGLLGVYRQLLRLCAHVGLPNCVRVDDARGADDHIDPLLPAGIDFMGSEDGRLDFQVDHLGTQQATLDALCFELARAFWWTTMTPAADRLTSRDPHDESIGGAQLAATASYLGLGSLAADAALRFLKEERLDMHGAIGRWGHVKAAQVPAGDLTFLLAVQLTVRAVEEPSLGRLLATMQLQQAGDTKAWLTKLAGSRRLLVDRLGLPSPIEFPPPREVELPPLGIDEVALRQAEAERRLNRDVPVFRIRSHRSLGLGALGMVLGMLGGATATMLLGENPLWFFVTGAAAGVAGSAVGRMLPHHRCSHCSEPLRRDADRCSGCQGRVCGEATGSELPKEYRTAAADQLATEEWEEQELAAQALCASQSSEFGENGKI